jgi:hypothetical protein
MKSNAYVIMVIPAFAVVGYAIAFTMAAPIDRVVFAAVLGFTLFLSALLFMRLYRARPGSASRTDDPKRRLFGLAFSCAAILSFSVYMLNRPLLAIASFASVAIALIAVANLLILIVSTASDSDLHT